VPSNNALLYNCSNITYLSKPIFTPDCQPKVVEYSSVDWLIDIIFINARKSACHDIANKKFSSQSRITNKTRCNFYQYAEYVTLEKFVLYTNRNLPRVLLYCCSYIKIQRSSNHAQEVADVKSFSWILKTSLFVSFAEVSNVHINNYVIVDIT